MGSGFKSIDKAKDSVVLLVNLAAHDSKMTDAAKTKTLADFIKNNQLKEIIPTPTQPGNEKEIVASIVDTLRQQVKEHGTFRELRFSGHGSSATLYHGKAQTPLGIDSLLNAIETAQTQLGIKIADKISFVGCNSFTNLTPEWVNYLRTSSINLRAEIVGLTEYGVKTTLTGKENLKNISFKDGEVGHFSKEFKNPLLESDIKSVKAEESLTKGLHYSDKWMQCHEGKTQQEGTTCQQNHAGGEAILDTIFQWLSAPSRAQRTPNKDKTPGL